MFDTFDLPNGHQAILDSVFTSFSPTAGGVWVPWHKPRNCKFVLIQMRGAAGGGGGGFTGAASAAGGGGGGGGGGFGSAVYFADLLPDVLWISVGTPGAGGSGSGQAGKAAIASYIGTAPATTAGLQMIYSSTAAGGGAAGATSGAAAVGAAGAISIAGTTFGQIGIAGNVAATAGGAGGTATTAAAGASVTATGVLTMGGAGGGAIGTAGAGGAVVQATSKVTAFTLSKTCGTIQFAADALGADTTSGGTVWTNTTIAATDVVVFTHSTGGTLGAYSIACTPASGSATIYIRNNTPGSLSEAPIFRFAVIKGVVA